MRGRDSASAEYGSRKQGAGARRALPRVAGGQPAGQWPPDSQKALYAAESISPSSSPLLDSFTLIIQPSPKGSLLTCGQGRRGGQWVGRGWARQGGGRTGTAGP